MGFPHGSEPQERDAHAGSGGSVPIDGLGEGSKHRVEIAARERVVGVADQLDVSAQYPSLARALVGREK
jgi:hypothetical protein